MSKFDAKADEGIFLGYSSISKAFRVFNKKRRIVEESIHVKFDEDSYSPDQINHPPSILDELISNPDDHDHLSEPIASNLPATEEATEEATEDPIINPTEEHAADSADETENPNDDQNVFGHYDFTHDDFVATEDEQLQNIREHRNHPLNQVIGDLHTGVQTRHKITSNFCMFVNFVSLIEPKKIDEALREADWIKAMQDELNEFKRHNVWTLVPRPQGKTIIGTRWVFRNKVDEDGIVTRNKARLVAQGFTQLEGLDYDETFAPVARLEAIRLFLAFASFKNFKVYQMDVKTAFLHGDLQEEVFLKQPPGFENAEFPYHVYRLDKAVYGLKQAPRAWYDTLSSYLLSNGYKRGAIDNTLFIKTSGDHIILAQVYVDDIIFGSTDEAMSKEFADIMAQKFEMSMMGELTFFLGLQVKQLPKGIFISQSKYVTDLLKKYSFSDCKPAKTPMVYPLNLHPDPSGADTNSTEYRGMIGSLLYLTASRPDIMFATSMCARFQANPKESHLIAVKRIFRYLKHTPNLGLWYPRESEFKLVGYTDSDHGGCVLDRKSTSGGCQLLGNRLISWSSKKQTSVACSTAEAEYVAAGRCVAQVLWIQNQLLDYGLTFTKTPILCDNTSAILITQNPIQHSRTKHMDIRHHFIRDVQQKGKIVLLHVNTEDQLADLFTKPLNDQTSQHLIGELGMISME